MSDRHLLPSGQRLQPSFLSVSTACLCRVASSHPVYKLSVFFLHVALRPQKRRCLLGTGGGEGGGRNTEISTAEYRPKKTGETVDRRQNNRSVKAMSPRHCPATSALCSCCFNCRAWAVARTMSVALLLRNNLKRKKSNFCSPAPLPCS